MSSRPKASAGLVDQRGHHVEVVEVGGDHHGPAPGRLDLSGHLVELLVGAGRDDHVGAGLGQGDGGGGADAPPGSGDDGDRSVSGSGRGSSAPTLAQAPVGVKRVPVDVAGRAQAGRVEGRPSLRWSHDTVRSTCEPATTTRLWSMVSTNGRSSSV